ncbi:MAG: hypothetical protein COA78_06935 [Blastopirellula sp.]|nr:MAG: hypothetical protein COA78_06935 [Blastopirellula sp.]
MKLIVPLAVNDARLTDSNVTETAGSEGETEWTAGTYGLDVVRMITTTANGASIATHIVYTSSKLGNTQDPSAGVTYKDDDDKDVLWWAVTRSTNRFKMFGQVVQDQTAFAEEITAEITPADYVNALSLHNVDAASVRIEMTETVQGDFYDKTYSLVSVYGIDNWYNWFYDEVVRNSDFAIFDLPNIAGAVIDVTISDAGGTAKCGACVVGRQIDLGLSLADSSFSITNYSTKTVDSVGRATISAGPYAKRSTVQYLMDTVDFPKVQRALALTKDTPVVSVADEDNDGTINYGFIERFKHTITEAGTIGSIDIQGLT